MINQSSKLWNCINCIFQNIKLCLTHFCHHYVAKLYTVHNFLCVGLWNPETSLETCLNVAGTSNTSTSWRRKETTNEFCCLTRFNFRCSFRKKTGTNIFLTSLPQGKQVRQAENLHRRCLDSYYLSLVIFEQRQLSLFCWKIELSCLVNRPSDLSLTYNTTDDIV